MSALLERLSRLVREAPEKVCIETTERSLSRNEFWQLILRQEELLRSAGLHQRQRVAIQMPRGPEWLASALACWRLGASWFPLSTSGPDHRSNACVEQARPALVIDEEEPRHVSEDASALPDEAYVIFTSGSTGSPKGVAVGHAGLVSMLNGQVERFQVEDGSRVFWGLSPLFDASISDWGTALLAGATLCIRDESALFADALRRHEVSHADIPPSLLPSLDPDDFPTIFTVVIGGEVTDPDAVRKWARSRKVFNVYGPTEATVCASTQPCGREWSTPNIGFPLPGVRFLVDGGDSSNEGELWIGGEQVALGYLQAGQSLRDRFTTVDGVRFYKTGDLVRHSEAGFIFLGRTDRQLKLRGKLIAPEEVEGALLALPGLNEAYVQANDSGKLIAYVAPDSGDEEEMRFQLAEKLPEWMRPHCIVGLPKLPRTENGKVARHRLPSPAARSLRSTVTEVIEKISGQRIREELGFCDNGLDSLDALRASIALCREGLPISPETLMNASRLCAEGLADASSGVQLRELAQAETVSNSWEALSHNTDGAVFLTGATGGLGQVLLRELVLAGRDVICLVRARGGRTAKERADCLLSKLQIDRTKICVLPGDVDAPNLGLSTDNHAIAVKNTAQVLNCAANVSLTSTFDQLRRPNVSALQGLTEFCSQAGAVLHQISTLAVVASQWPRPSIALEEKLQVDDTFLFGGYAQSKAAAEFTLYRAEIPWVIYRLGLLLNEDGSNSPQLLREEAKDGVHRGPNLMFDVTPTTWCARVLVALMQRAQPGEIRHIAGNRKLSAPDIHGSANERAAPLEAGESIPSSLYLASGIDFDVAQRDSYEEWAGPQPDAALTLKAHLEARQ